MQYSKLGPVLLIVGLLFAVPLPAQTRTIRVTGTGRVPVKPSQLELQLNVAGSSELASDALKKYNQALVQAKDAFEGLGIQGLEFKPMGVSVKQQSQNQQQFVAVNGQQQNQTSMPVTFGRSIRVGVAGIDGLSDDELSELLVKLIDTAKDSGAAVQGQMDQLAQIYGTQFANSMVFFVVTEVDSARESAYEQAMDTARRRADRLAKLSGTQVGKVHTISESFTLPQDSSSPQMRMVYAAYGIQSAEQDDYRVMSSEFKEVDIKVTLTVEFEID